MKRFLSKISVAALLLATCFNMTPVKAGGITLTVSPNTSSTSPQDVTLTWTGGPYASGTVITISSDHAFTSITRNSSTPTIDLDGDLTTDGDITAPGTTSVQYVLTHATTLTTNSLNLTLTFDGSATNYALSMYASGSVADFGSALFYAHGGNQVNVSANVPASLSFAIRNAADDADSHSCDLGALSSTASSTCSYRLKIGTNAANGFQATVVANHDLTDSHSDVITSIADDAASNPGSAQYGISTVEGATAGGWVSGDTFTSPITVDTQAGYSYNTLNTPVSTSTAQDIVGASHPFDNGGTTSLTNTTLVTHFANINSATPAGNYSQTVTYVVTGSY